MNATSLDSLGYIVVINNDRKMNTKRLICTIRYSSAKGSEWREKKSESHYITARVHVAAAITKQKIIQCFLIAGLIVSFFHLIGTRFLRKVNNQEYTCYHINALKVLIIIAISPCDGPRC